MGESTVLPVSKVQQQLGQQPLDAATAGLIFHPAVSLWGVICHQRGDILALVLLGPRGDDDPYQPQDVTELEQVLSAAALALTNSASYEEQVAARTMIRQLYQHAQQIEEQTAAEIAQEIHDEVLNVNLRLNIELLQGLIAEARDPRLQEQLQLVLDGEQTMSQMLRLICEQLKPSGFDHPLGLPASLRQQTDRVRASWLGQVTLEVENTAVPVEEHIHRALARITREALTNAVKHAAATAITVRLRFPAHPTDALALSVCDNGQGSREPITPRAGHWGVQNMQEYADAIGATICWSHLAAGGTCVEVTVPAAALRAEVAKASARGAPLMTALNSRMSAPPSSAQEA
jgi:signal transduction histidine kinase